MRKMLFAVAFLIMTSSVFAWEDGTIVGIRVSPEGTFVELKVSESYTGFDKVNLTGDELKRFLSVALTAKVANKPVSMNWAPGGWNGIKIK